MKWFCSNTIPTKYAVSYQQKVPKPSPVSPNHLVLAQTSFSSFRMKFTSVDTHRDCLLRCRNGHAVVNWKLDDSPRPLTPLLPIHKITDGSCFFIDRMGLLLRQYSQELICKEELQQLKESWQTTAKDGKQS